MTHLCVNDAERVKNKKKLLFFRPLQNKNVTECITFESYGGIHFWPKETPFWASPPGDVLGTFPYTVPALIREKLMLPKKPKHLNSRFGKGEIFDPKATFDNFLSNPTTPP